MVTTFHKSSCHRIDHYRYVVAAAAVALAVLAGSDGYDLPVATHGFEQWAGVVAKAMSYGGRDQNKSLQALKSFQAKVASNMQKQAGEFKKMQSGDFSDIVGKLLSPKVDIQAPVFFHNGGGPDSLISGGSSGVAFGFVGASYAPCAISVAPLGVSIFPQGALIGAEVFNIGPTGVNIQPQGASISPSLIVIGPYDTTVAGQGLNIAPALIAIAPIRTVVNPTGPLAIADVLVAATVPALP
ncbi:g5149 [Coccomyxa elongata]